MSLESRTPARHGVIGLQRVLLSGTVEEPAGQWKRAMERGACEGNLAGHSGWVRPDCTHARHPKTAHWDAVLAVGPLGLKGIVLDFKRSELRWEK